MPENTNFGYWNDLLANAPDSYKKWFEDEMNFLVANVPSGSRVLEVGCGSGRSMEHLAERCRLYGVDYDPNAVSLSKERFRKNPNVSMMLENGMDLPFRNDWFDRTLSLITPVNFGRDRNRFYAEMKRVTKPDGEILLTVFNEEQRTFNERMNFYTRSGAPIKLVKGTTVTFDYPLGAGTSEQFSRPQLIEIFQENRLIPLEIQKQGMAYFCRLGKT